MFSAPLAILSCALINDRWQILTIVAEFDPRRQSRTSFIEYFTGHYAVAGDDRFKYRLAEVTDRGVVRDFYTKDRLDCGKKDGK